MLVHLDSRTVATSVTTNSAILLQSSWAITVQAECTSRHRITAAGPMWQHYPVRGTSLLQYMYKLDPVASPEQRTVVTHAREWVI